MEPITRLELYLTCIINGETPPEPITRIELYLAKIAGAAVDIPTPETRIELYLAKIAGESVLIPTPITRIEMYLAKIAGVDVQIPTPITRLEMLLYEWAQAPVGEIVTVTGVSPLLLEGAVAGYLESLLQRGKCEVENGAIKCNNGTLVVPNLADMSESNVVMGKFINNEGGESSSSSNFYCTALIPVEAGTDYTMHTSVRIGYYSVMEYDANGDFIKRTLYGSNNYRAGDIITHTMGESTAYIRWGSNPKYQAITYDYVIGIDWMLSKGSTAQEFVPYKKAVASGTVEVITATSGDTAGVVDLLAVGSVADTQDIVSGAVTRRTAAILYDGTQDVGKPYLSSTGALDVGAIVVHAPGTEYSGDVAAFTTEEATPINAAIVSMEPVQDLHGYDKPWAGGAGKNLVDVPSVTGVTSQTQIGAVTLPAGDYVLSAYISNAGISGAGVRITKSDNTTIKSIGFSSSTTASRYSGTFTLAEETDCKIFVIGNASGYNASVSNVQVEAGTILTDYAPYSNECPITGWTEATLTKAGKNLLDVQDRAEYTDGGVTFSCVDSKVLASGTTTAGANRSVIPSGRAINLPAGTYTFSLDGTCVNCVIQLRRVTGSPAIVDWINSTRTQTTVTLTEATACYVNVNCSTVGVEVNADCFIQLERGSIATDWEPYVAETNYHETFPATPGTVYGGTLDVVNGTLTVDRALFAGTEFKTLGARSGGIYGRIYIDGNYVVPGSAYLPSCKGNLISIVTGTAYNWHATPGGSAGASSSYLHIYAPSSALLEYHEGDNMTTLFNAKYDATAFRFVLPIDPVVYQLTPQQIDTLAGGNVFSSDAGAVEIWVQAAPTVESAAPQALRLTAGSNTLTVTAAVSGIELEAEYMAAN